jgi:hypothetical protein
VVEAALLAIQVTTNIEDILFRLCAPDDHARVTTGACSLGCWDAPVEISATYHAEAAHIARDLALSWLELHEGARVPSTAGLSMEALRSRVEAAPPGARVGVARHVEGLHERWRQWKAAEEAAKQAHVPRPPRDGRKIAPGHDELTREHVLAALSTSPATLLEALEAAAVADEEWRAVEPIALETIEATKRGAPTYDVDVTTRKHVQFVQQHAPFRVRRLPNGGVMLATHPHRILWPLWADALQLLGVR